MKKIRYILSLLSVIVLLSILVASCTAADAITDSVYIKYLYVWDGANWNQITVNGGGGAASAFIDLNDVPGSYIGDGGKCVSVKIDETGLEFTAIAAGDMFKATYDPDNNSVIEGAQLNITISTLTDGTGYLKGDGNNISFDNSTFASSFIDLDDVPSDYTDDGGKYVAVKATEDGLEFVTLTAGDMETATYDTDDDGLIDATAGGTEWDSSGQTGFAYITAGTWSAIAKGIADGNVVVIDAADVADNDYAKFTANGLEGRSYTEVRSDLGVGGGLYGINVETLGVGVNRTLVSGVNSIYQYFNPSGGSNDITLDTASASAGDRFIIRHNGDYDESAFIRVFQGANTLDYIYPSGVKEFIYDGTNWVSGENGTGENDNKNQNVALGYRASARQKGTAIGRAADAYYEGVAVGLGSSGTWDGVALGYSAIAISYGVAIGYYANSSYGIAIGQYSKDNNKIRSIALGHYSRCYRYGETSINIDGNSSQKNNVTQGRWSDSIAGGAGATQIYLADYGTQRFTIYPSSHLAFEIKVVARDNTANEGAMYTFEGLIKRDAANNTVLSVCNKTVVYEDDATWDCNVTADDVNEALIITCTGDGANITQWAAVLDGCETHF